jgi:hypothetical protein
MGCGGKIKFMIEGPDEGRTVEYFTADYDQSDKLLKSKKTICGKHHG